MSEELLADFEPDEEEEVTKVEEKEKPKTYVFDGFFFSNGSLTQDTFFLSNASLFSYILQPHKLTKPCWLLCS